MRLPLQIRFIGMDPSEAVEAAARGKAEHLERFCGDITSCRVTIESLHHHRHQGHPFAVRIDVTLPGHELGVDRVEREDVYVALRDAFDDMRRRVEDSVRRTRGDEKLHAGTLHGEVVRLEPDDRRGFIRTAAGDEYWFGPENVSGVPWEHVATGDEVTFIPEMAAQGLQAKRVRLGRHGGG